MVFPKLTTASRLSGSQYDLTSSMSASLNVEDAKVQRAAQANRLRPAHDEEILAAGMVPGYGSPIGAQSDIVVVDESAAHSNNLVAGANRDGYHLLNTNFERDYTGTVADIASAGEGHACSECGHPLTVQKGVEVGNIFQLGTRYSETMGCYFQTEDGKREPVIMGSYGIGVGRLLACVAEEYAGDSGMSLPVTIAPYQVHLVSLVKDSEIPDGLYEQLLSEGVDVLYDDRKGSAGVKFNDADLIGIPIRITIGNRGLKENSAEVTVASEPEKRLIGLDSIITEIKSIISSRISQLYDRIDSKSL